MNHPVQLKCYYLFYCLLSLQFPLNCNSLFRYRPLVRLVKLLAEGEGGDHDKEESGHDRRGEGRHQVRDFAVGGRVFVGGGGGEASDTT